MYFQIQNGCKIVTILTPLPLQVWNLLGHTTYMASPMTRLVKPALNHVQKLLLRWVPPPQLRWQATTAIPQRKMAIYLTYGLLVVNHAHSTKLETPITYNQNNKPKHKIGSSPSASFPIASTQRPLAQKISQHFLCVFQISPRFPAILVIPIALPFN